MKTYPPLVARPARHLRVPAFAPVPMRARADGWTPLRQAAFLAALAETGSVSAAARRVGMARETAYRLRRRRGAASFAAAWDKVTGRRTGPMPKVTAEDIVTRATQGLLKPHFHRGQHVATLQKADDSALLRYLRQLDHALVPEADGGERSQSFGGPVVSTGQGRT